MRHKALAPLPFSRIEVRLAGSGGQGLILAGLVLAEAAGIYDGREVAMVQSVRPRGTRGYAARPRSSSAIVPSIIRCALRWIFC